jgi:hypothetical protein
MRLALATQGDSSPHGGAAIIIRAAWDYVEVIAGDDPVRLDPHIDAAMLVQLAAGVLR